MNRVEAAAKGGNAQCAPTAAASWRLYHGVPQTSLPEGDTGPHVLGPGWWAVPAGSEASQQENCAGQSHLSSSLRSAPPLLVITDADSTLIEQEVIDELAHIAGVGAEVAAITESAMQGNLDFAWSLRERVALLKGLPISALDRVRHSLRLTLGARELIRWTHAVGGKFAVVSGGFAEVLQPLITELGIDYLDANRLEVKGGYLTGRVSGPIVDAEAKRRALLQWSGNAPERTVAVGDGANDVKMLRTAGLGVAFCAKPAVKVATASFLDLPRLDAVVGLLGQGLETDVTYG